MGGASGSNLIGQEKGGVCDGGVVGDGGVVVCARDILGGRHGGQRTGDGRAEETRVVGGPTASGLGREPMDLSGQTGCSGGGMMMMVLRRQLLVRNGRACPVTLVSGVSQRTSRYRPR